ncbi:MAG: hypothetical protein AAF849_04620 [Bacteroidota bacterium]
MKSLLIIFLSLFLFSTSIFGQDTTTTVVLTPTDDVYSQNGSIRNTEELELKFGRKSIYMKFDLSNLQGDVTKAKLVLTSTTKSTRSIINVYESIDTTWTEETITWSNRVNKDDSDLLGSWEDDNQQSFEAGKVIEIDLNQTWRAKNVLSLIIQRASGRIYSHTSISTVTTIAASENDNESYRPKLVLTINGTINDDGDDGDTDDDDDDSTDNDDNTDNDDDDDNNNDGNNTSDIWSIEEDGTIYYNGGNVGIGTTTPLTKFVVDGEIRATKVRVRGDVNLPDYVFEPDYELRSLEEVATYIDANGHLPEVPSAEQVEQEGLSLGDMDATLLKKIEELTLYMIEMKRENEALKQEVTALKQQLKQ